MKLSRCAHGCLLSMMLVMTGLLVSIPGAFASIDRYIVVNRDLYRGGQPTEERDFKFLRAQGVKTIINLRVPDKDAEWEEAQAKRFGLNYRNYGFDGLSYPDERLIERIQRDMTDPRLMPVFIHCYSGKDRTGLLVGLYRVHEDEWPARRAYDEMRDIGFNDELHGLVDYFRDHSRSSVRRASPPRKGGHPARRRLESRMNRN